MFKLSLLLILLLPIFLFAPAYIEDVYFEEVEYKIYSVNPYSSFFNKLRFEKIYDDKAILHIYREELNEETIMNYLNTSFEDYLFQTINASFENLSFEGLNNRNYLFVYKTYDECYNSRFRNNLGNSINSLKYDSKNKVLYVSMKWDEEFINSGSCMKGPVYYRNIALIVLEEEIDFSGVEIVSHSFSRINYTPN